MDAAFGGQTAGGHPRAFPRPRQPLFAVPDWRELESSCRVSIFQMKSQYPQAAFQGIAGGQEKGTQTLRVHLLGIGSMFQKHSHSFMFTLGASLCPHHKTGIKCICMLSRISGIGKSSATPSPTCFQIGCDPFGMSTTMGMGGLLYHTGVGSAYPLALRTMGRARNHCSTNSNLRCIVALVYNKVEGVGVSYSQGWEFHKLC